MSTKKTLIAEIDATLAMLRKNWLAAKDAKESGRWWDLINKTLDERLAAMAL